MKKQSIFVTAILFLMTFFLAIPIFNKYSVLQVDNYFFTFDKGTEWNAISVERSKTNRNPFEIRSIMDEKAVENNIVIYQLKTLTDDLGNFVTTLNVTSNEHELADKIYLAKGTLTNIDKVYSTNSKDKSTRIANILIEDVYSVEPFTNQIDTGGMFYCRNLHGNIDENIVNWANDVAQEIDGFSFNLQPNIAQYDYDESIPLELFGDKLIKVACSIIVVLFLCLYTFQLYQNIGIYKLEGHSNLEIYWLLFERYYLVFSLIAVSLITLSGLILFGSAINTLKLYLLIVISQWVQLSLLVQFLSFALVIIIASVPSFSASKGKNYLQEIQFIGYAAKYIIALLLLPIIIPHLDTAQNLLIMMSNHDKALQVYENKYRFGTQVPSGWIRDIGTQNVINLYDDIAKDTGMFQFGIGYINFSLEYNPHPDEIYVANWTYLVNNGYVNQQDDPNRYRLFMTENLRDKEQEYLDYYLNNYGQYGATQDNFDVIYIEPNFPVFDYYQLLFSDNYYTKPIVYIPVEQQFLGQVNGHVFNFDGPLSQAQQYINDKFIEYGYSPMFQIVSEQANVQQFYDNLSSKYIKGLIRFVFVLLCYIFTTVFMFDCDYELNHKKYRIAYFEGQSVYRLPGYVLRFISPLLLALLSCLILNKLALNIALVKVIGSMVIVELVSYLVYLRKCYRRG